MRCDITSVMKYTQPSKTNIDGLVQGCNKPSALAMELLQPCTKPSISACLSRDNARRGICFILIRFNSKLNWILLLFLVMQVILQEDYGVSLSGILSRCIGRLSYIYVFWLISHGAESPLNASAQVQRSILHISSVLHHNWINGDRKSKTFFHNTIGFCIFWKRFSSK